VTRKGRNVPTHVYPNSSEHLLQLKTPRLLVWVELAQIEKKGFANTFQVVHLRSLVKGSSPLEQHVESWHDRKKNVRQVAGSARRKVEAVTNKNFPRGVNLLGHVQGK
jgi:hypothetical protein